MTLQKEPNSFRKNVPHELFSLHFPPNWIVNLTFLPFFFQISPLFPWSVFIFSFQIISVIFKLWESCTSVLILLWRRWIFSTRRSFSFRASMDFSLRRAFWVCSCFSWWVVDTASWTSKDDKTRGEEGEGQALADRYQAFKIHHLGRQSLYIHWLIIDITSFNCLSLYRMSIAVISVK